MCVVKSVRSQVVVVFILPCTNAKTAENQNESTILNDEPTKLFFCQNKLECAKRVGERCVKMQLIDVQSVKQMIFLSMKVPRLVFVN